MAKEGRKEGEIIEGDAVAFGNMKGLAAEIRRIQSITNLPNPTRRPAGVRKGYYARLFEEEGLLSEFYEKYRPRESPAKRAAWRERYENWRRDYENDLAKAKRSPPIRFDTKEPPKQAEPAETTLTEDIKGVIDDPKIGATGKLAQILARIGQGEFRKCVLEQWGDCCAVTGSKTREAIRASHIKPWRDCDPTNGERLDVNNGLPLVASLDALFDRGLISFESSGEMKISSNLSVAEQEIFGIAGASLTRKPTEKMVGYLAYHRDNCFQK